MAPNAIATQLIYYKNLFWEELENRKILKEFKPEKPKIYAGPDIDKPTEKTIDKPVKTVKPVRTSKLPGMTN
jgi:hypothetical protein